MKQKLRLIRGRRARKQSRTSEKTLRNRDPLNHAPDHADTALLLIDVINDLEFEGGDKLLPHALAMAGALAALKRRAKAHDIPVIYTNDNFGRWRSDFPRLTALLWKRSLIRLRRRAADRRHFLYGSCFNTGDGPQRKDGFNLSTKRFIHKGRADDRQDDGEEERESWRRRFRHSHDPIFY